MNTFQVKFLHRRQAVVNKLNIYPFVHPKNLSNMHFDRNFVPFGCSDSGGCKTGTIDVCGTFHHRHQRKFDVAIAISHWERTLTGNC